MANTGEAHILTQGQNIFPSPQRIQSFIASFESDKLFSFYIWQNDTKPQTIVTKYSKEIQSQSINTVNN